MLIEKFAKVHESFELTWAYFEMNRRHDFVLKPGGTQGFLLFGVHLELKLEAEIKGWNPKNDPTEENHFDIADEESDILNFF